MNELEIRKIAKEEFISNVMNNLDSALIFTYIQNLEQKVNNLQSKIDKINLFKLYLQERLLEHKDEIERGANEFDERDECEDILNEFINFFKEDK